MIDGRAIRRAETLPPEFWGYIIDIKFPKKERQGKDVVKFHLYMRGGHDTLFIFEAGTEAFFARAVMTVISTCEIAALQRPLKLLSFVTETQSNNKTLSAVLYTSEGTKLHTSWTGSDDWRAIALKARENIWLAKGGQVPPPAGGCSGSR